MQSVLFLHGKVSCFCAPKSGIVASPSNSASRENGTRIAYSIGVTKIVISASPAVKRFNAAVERADLLLYPLDDLSVPDMLFALRFASWSKPDTYLDAANELEASHRALNDSKP